MKWHYLETNIYGSLVLLHAAALNISSLSSPFRPETPNRCCMFDKNENEENKKECETCRGAI